MASERWIRRLMMGLHRQRAVDGVPPAREPEELLERRVYADPRFLAHFLDWLDEQIYQDPRKGLRWSKIVPDLALKIIEGDGSERRPAHREGLIRAWAMLGGAYRACGDHDASEEAFRKALDLAALLHLCGEHAELEKVAGETYQLFRLLSGAQQETLSALGLWVDAVRTRRWEDSEEADPGKGMREYDQLHAKARQLILARAFSGRKKRRS